MGGTHCPHQGCIEAKKVLLHLKTCPAVNGSVCPINCNGCHQARKLLAHHKRCRELRAKQAGIRRGQPPQQHVCLVCSLVARHARNLLEGKTRPARTPNPRKQVISSFTLKQTAPDSTVLIPRGLNPGNMPPPPPRPSASRSSSSSPIPIRGRGRLRQLVEDSPDSMSESPPSENHLMQFSAVAAAAAPPGASPSNPSALGKSLDSSKSSFLTFAAGMLQKMKESPSLAEGRRSRAESLDMSSVSRHHKARYMPSVQFPGNDPTLEFELQREMGEYIGEGNVVRRPRSASLGVLVDCALQRACPPIQEESHEVREPEEQPFLMEEEEE